ncbi:GNAT family N-acetyltransferase [Catenuloplanes indicus]|uniref:Ribosomal protein S18 acetylase RimI-like enzyme n=1 Tax=Catenuloplanes indicus TaxID=137267 RepID=A0AAE3W5Y1_9ACTN|nr:GNAT family N-acetyltransferase [Catenuloplanes indicus]MDQ0370191.1 ribosomal protein S18 acetylase RimI-like enzyme [Catenuloplanes indicus]
MEIRACTTGDVGDAVKLLHLTSASDARIRWRRLLTAGGVHAVVAADGGRVVGAALLGSVADYRGQRAIGLGVAPDARGRGIGTALAAELVRADRSAGPGAGPVAMTMRDDLPRGLRFAERLDLRVYNHCTGWTITLDDPAALRPAAHAAATRSNVRLETTTLGESRARFVAAAGDSLAGMPTDTPIDLERFAADMPDHVVVLFATDADGTAGVCLIRPDGDTGGWHTSYTGVATRARRRGVARALKLGSFVAAAERGGIAMHGENDDRNAPMLALSAAVGMRRGLGYWSLVTDRLAQVVPVTAGAHLTAEPGAGGQPAPGRRQVDAEEEGVRQRVHGQRDHDEYRGPDR